MIREAERKDDEQIQSLYKLLCPDLPVKVLPERIDQIKNDPNNFLIVYENQTKVVGTIFFSICMSPMFGFQPFGVIEYFIVDSNYRGQGIGSQLIEFVFDLGRQKKCTAILLLSSNFRDQAHNFFEKHGFNSNLKKGFVKYLNR